MRSIFNFETISQWGGSFLENPNFFIHILFCFMILIGTYITLVELNSLHYVLFLILLFFNTFLLLLLWGVEFFGLAILIIYVGAIAILFIFLIMTVKEVEISQDHKLWAVYLTKNIKVKKQEFIKIGGAELEFFLLLILVFILVSNFIVS